MQEVVVNNRYSIVRALGGGGMARVYLAHDEVLDRDVALKVLREQFADDGEFVERFKREAKSAASLSHPNIVQVYDRGEAGDSSSYIAMEYVQAGTLKERISSDGPLDPGVAASLALQIAGALGAAHERGVIHRDIKPQNVLLSAAGDAKVADFGIARAASAATISQRSVVLGTASYMSPEQAMGEPATPRSDLYSLGVVLYEMVTGELPYTAESPVAVCMKHVNEPLRPPREVNPLVPEGMNALVVRLLAKDPEDRYADAADLAEDLRRVSDGLPPLAAGGSIEATQLVPSAATAHRNTPWILAAILAALILIGGIGLALSQGLGGQDSPSGQTAGVNVPSVEGLSREQAEQKLNAAGFRVDVRPQESSAADAGKVLDQSPAGGERAKEGSEVVLDVGDGPLPVKVPKVVGMSVPEAKAALDEAGLTLGFQREVPSDTTAEGIIVEQRYPAGTRVEPETAVNIGVSSGPEQQPASSSASSSARASVSASASASASATASAPALGENAGEDGNSGSGSGNSGPGSSGD